MLELGVESTLAPDNRLILDSIKFSGVDIGDRIVAPLFDPQTGGGLLFGAKPKTVDETLSFLADNGFAQACVIGKVVDAGDGVAITVG